MRTLIGLVLILALVTGCQSGQSNPTNERAMHWQRTEMYFGQTRRDGSTISDQEWQRFLETEIVPRFPSGLTVLNADGRWRDQGGKIHTEASRVLVVLYPPDDADAVNKLDQIARAYCMGFDQEAVMRLDSDEQLRFITPQPE